MGKVGVTVNNKKQNKIILITFSVFVCVIVSLFFATYINLILLKSEIKIYNFLPHVIITSMLENKIHFMIFLSTMLMSLMCIFLVMNIGNNESFKSELDTITDTIKTPKKIGQSQHGSARWLTESEYNKIFCSYDINPNKNIILKKLKENGLKDKKEVSDYKNKIAK